MGATAELVRRWADLYSNGTPGSFHQLYAEDVDWLEAPTSITPQGRSGDLQAIRQASAFGHSMFRDQRVLIDEIIEDGHRAVWIGTWMATIGIDGLPFPNGTAVRFPMAMLIETRDGLIVRQRDFPTAPVVSE